MYTFNYIIIMKSQMDEKKRDRSGDMSDDYEPPERSKYIARASSVANVSKFLLLDLDLDIP